MFKDQGTGDLFQAILIAGVEAGAVSDDKLRFKQEFSPSTVVLGCTDGMYAYSFLTKMAGYVADVNNASKQVRRFHLVFQSQSVLQVDKEVNLELRLLL